MSKENIVIVEALSTGANYISDIRKLGYNPICLEICPNEDEIEESRAVHDRFYSFFNDDEIPQTLIADKEYEKTLSMVNEFNPLAVIPGCDEGIVLATKLAHDLGLPGNNPDNLKKMINKQHMQEALKDAGIRYIKSQVINSFEEAKEFTSQLDNPYVVIKPAVGEATIGVCICKNDDQLKDAIEINKDISFDIDPNNDVNIIIQEYIGGDEYMIDSVCCKGNNRVISAFRYEKILIEGRGAIYDYAEAIDESHPNFAELAEYNDKVLSALGLEYGATHGEYKFDENGPVLIEMNCRVAGVSQKYDVMERVWGEHSTELSLESYINPNECIKKSKKPLEIQSYYIFKVLIIYEELDVVNIKFEEAFKNLESFEYALSFYGGNRVYPKTIDLATCGGLVFLTNANKKRLFEDLNEIKRMEKSEIEKIFDIK